jgi:hypothetical protein
MGIHLKSGKAPCFNWSPHTKYVGLRLLSTDVIAKTSRDAGFRQSTYLVEIHYGWLFSYLVLITQAQRPVLQLGRWGYEGELGEVILEIVDNFMF